MISTAAFAALSCQNPHDEITPVRSQWCPMTIGPDACAKASFMMVRLAVPAAAPPASAHSRKLRRDNFFAMTAYSFVKAGLSGQPEITMHDFSLRLQFLRRAGMDDGALLHQKHTWAELERRFNILLNQQDRHSGLVDA